MEEHEIKPVNFKKIFIIVLSIILVIVAGLLILNFTKEKPKEETKKITKTSETLTEDKLVGHLSINNISLVTKNGKSIFSAKATNLTANELNIKSISISCIDAYGNEIISLTSYFGGIIGPEETKIITAETNIDLKKVDKLEFTLNE